ncbi:MAG: ABC transporter substrate-binding protein [Acidimicrobiia bacterium]|nr:ABC transporter substrate-binding protein [Acidimicrobiia bacterium]
MDLPRLKTALVTRGHTQALKDGTVRPATCAFDFEEVPVIIKAFRRMVRGLEFDVCEMAITTYICARAHGKRFTAIPVFPMRAFHHGAVVYNTRSGIRGPQDLEGRRVGVNRGYTVTTGVWARAILQHEHGVNLGRVTWVLSGDEHVAEWQPPENVVPLDSDRSLDELLAAGDIPAAISVHVDSPEVKPLIPNAADAGLAALRSRGLWPINHTIVVKDEVLNAHPDLAADLYRAFVEAKRLSMDRLDDPLLLKVRDVIGDPLPYGVAENRQMLDAIVQHAQEQGIIRRAIPLEKLFAAV